MSRRLLQNGPIVCFHGRIHCVFCKVGRLTPNGYPAPTPVRARVRHCVACWRTLKARESEHCSVCAAHHWEALRLFDAVA